MKRKEMFRNITLLLILGLLSQTQLIADNNEDQGANTYNRFSVGLSGGVISPFTDVRENPFFPDQDEITFGGRLMLNFHLSPVYTLQTNVLYGEMQGINTEENREFETDLIEATLNARISINKLLNPQGRYSESVNFYGFVGAGLLAYRSRLYENNEIINYYGYKDQGHTTDNLKPELIIPYGLGINFKVSERFDIGLETGFRYSTSRRLDAWPYGSDHKDQYNFTSIGITIRLGSNTRSMDWAPLSEVMYPGDVTRIDDLERRMDTLAEDAEALHATHEQDMESMRVQVEGISSEKAEIMQRTVQLFGAVEDLAGEVSRIDAEVEKLKEGPDQFYSVQVMALKEELPLDEARKHLGIPFDLAVYHINGWYKYISGQHKNLEEAILHMQRIWGRGVRDAFVVEYRDGMLYPR